MIGSWNLKTFFSISLGLHLLFISIVSILFPNFKIKQLALLHIEISLLPMIAEEKPASIPISRVPVKTQINKLEKKLQDEKKEEFVFKKKQEPESLPVQVEGKATPINDSPVLPSSIQEEKIILEEGLTFQGEKNLYSFKEASLKEENSIVAMPHDIHPKESQGNLPTITTSEELRNVVKYSSPSDGNIVFAQPKYGENPKLSYPQEARKKGYEGEVLLRVEVLSNGRVGQIEVRKSSGHEMLDRSALVAVKQWRIIPARKRENAIPFWVNIPIKFQLQ